MHVELWVIFILIVWHCIVISVLPDNRSFLEKNENVRIKCSKKCSLAVWIFYLLHLNTSWPYKLIQHCCIHGCLHCLLVLLMLGWASGHEPLINSTFDPECHVARSTSIKHGVALNKCSYNILHIPCSTTKPNGDSIHITDSGCSCSVIIVLDHHFASNTSIPGEAPLFAFKIANGSWAPLHRVWFLDRCREIWSVTGLNNVLGHSFRIGGTAFLLLLGVDPWIVMMQGRWSSQTFLTYWRRCEEILPPFHWLQSWFSCHYSLYPVSF